MKSHASRSDDSLNLFQTVGLWGSAFGAVWGRGAGEGLAEAQRGFPLSVEWKDDSDGENSSSSPISRLQI